MVDSALEYRNRYHTWTFTL